MKPAQHSQSHTCRFYDLGPTRIRVDAPESRLLAGFEWYIGERSSAPQSALPTFSISLQIGTPGPIPQDAETLYDGPLHSEGRCNFARKGHLYFMAFPNEALLVIDQQARRADAIMAHNRIERSQGSFVPIAIEFALDLQDQHVLHAAGLSLPGQEGMVLISAPSGTGKTTTALSLARSGLMLAADDVVILRRAENSLFALGVPRALHVHTDTAGLLPWLPVSTRWDTHGEQALSRSALKQYLTLEDRELTVSHLLLLSRGEEFSVSPVAQTEALSKLLADNVRGSSAGITPLQQRRLMMLTDLVKIVPSYAIKLPSGLIGKENYAARLIHALT